MNGESSASTRRRRDVDEAASRSVRRGWVLGVVGSAQFVLLLDLTIVNVALPTVQAELGVGAARLQWLVSAYALTFGGFLLLAGRGADVFGRLRMFVAGIVLFGVASLVAGLAVNEWMLVGARAGQGLGGAAVSPAALALLTTTFREGKERNRALGVFAAVASAGAASGLILGGVLTQWAGWRWVFLVNVPVAVAAAVVAPIVLRDARGRVSRPLDVAGAVTSTLTLVGLVFGLARAAEAGLGDAISVVALTAALGLGFAFVVAERRALDPLVPLRLLRLPSLLGTDLTAFAVSTLIAATPFLLTLYGQRVLGLTPVMTGLAFLPMTAAITATATIAARRAHRIGVRRLLLLGIGTLFVAALMLSRMPVDGRYLTDVLPGMLLFAVGLGASYTAAAIGGTAGVPDGDQGVAGGLLDTSKQVGGAIGLAVLAAVATGGGGLASQTDAALVEGVSNAFITALAFTAVAVVPVTSLVRRPSGHEKPSRLRQGAGQRLDTQTARKAPADGVSPVHGRPAGLEPLPAPC